MLRPKYEFCDASELQAGVLASEFGFGSDLPTIPTMVNGPNGPTHKYIFEMAQHPIRARMCGFGEKDRRPIDPPPVVKLRVLDERGQFMSSEDVDTCKFVVSATLWAPNMENDRSIVINPNTLPGPMPMYPSSSSSVMSLTEPVKVRNLVGTTVSGAYMLKDEQDEHNIFFIFHDLSVRTEGRFRLKFQFTIIPSQEQPRAFIESIVWSDTFEVYSAKSFPGMTDSTELSKAFAKQGIKITIRKSGRGRTFQQDDEGGEQEDDDA